MRWASRSCGGPTPAASSTPAATVVPRQGAVVADAGVDVGPVVARPAPSEQPTSIDRHRSSRSTAAASASTTAACAGACRATRSTTPHSTPTGSPRRGPRPQTRHVVAGRVVTRFAGSAQVAVRLGFGAVRAVLARRLVPAPASRPPGRRRARHFSSRTVKRKVASDEARYVTGVSLPVDAGWSGRMVATARVQPDQASTHPALSQPRAHVRRVGPVEPSTTTSTNSPPTTRWRRRSPPTATAPTLADSDGTDGDGGDGADGTDGTEGGECRRGGGGGSRTDT